MLPPPLACVLLAVAGIAWPGSGPSGNAPDGEAQLIDREGDGFTADADADTFAGPAPLTVRFTARSMNAKDPVRYAWNFDDGSGSGEQSPVHTFRERGWYLVTMEARDGGGQTYRVTLQLHAWRPRDWARFQETRAMRIVHHAARELERKRARNAAANQTGGAADSPSP
jgi:hypothetical protein